jgi:hypothetical protein
MSLHIYFNIYIIPLAKLQNRKHNLAISLEKFGVPLYFNLVWEEKVGFNLGIFLWWRKHARYTFQSCKVCGCVKGEAPVKLSSNVV